MLQCSIGIASITYMRGLRMMPAPAFGVLPIGLAGACTWIEFGMYIRTNYTQTVLGSPVTEQVSE